jgi:hypothetical protein
LRHICSNFNKEFKNAELKEMVWRAGSQRQLWKFDQAMEEIKKKNENAYKWLRKIPEKKWALAHDEGGARFGQRTTNLVECFNGVMKGARSLPVTSLAEFTWYKLVSYFSERRYEPEKWAQIIFTPRMQARLEKLQERSGRHGVTMFDRDSGEFEILTGYYNTSEGPKGGNRQVHHVYIYYLIIRYIKITILYIVVQTVVLSQKTCSCQKWQLFHMPCSHALAAIKKVGHRISDHVCPSFTVAEYKATYAPMFSPIPDKPYWPHYEGMFFKPDPERKRKTGRPRSTRLKNEMDRKEQADDASKRRCTLCKQRGHTKRKCALRNQ